MELRRRPFANIALMIVEIPLALVLVVLTARELGLPDYVRKSTNGTIVYRCGFDNGASADFDVKTADPVVLNLVAQRHPRSATNWSVQRPGSPKIKASGFAVDTHSYGGSQGLAWRTASGRSITATLSFSDIDAEYGPATIWVKVSQLPGPKVAQDGEWPSGALICGPDPTSFRYI